MPEYVVKGQEEVYDFSNKFIGAKPVEDVRLRADSLNEAIVRARSVMQQKVDEYRGNIEDKDLLLLELEGPRIHIAEVVEVRDVRDRVLHKRD